MVFRTRNPFYLRISEKNVLPLYVYLDEAHVNWMTDSILQHVLADLQPKILPKLKAEADILKSGPAANKKATVDTHRGDSYEFCYFIRKTEQHSVLIKTRHFSAAPPRPKAAMPLPPPAQPQASKRKDRKNSTPQSSNKRRKTKGKGKAHDSDASDEAVSSEDEDAEVDDAPDTSAQPRRSQRNKKIVAGGYQQDDEASDVEMEDRPQNEPEADDIQIKNETTEPQLTQANESGDAAAPIHIDIDGEEEEKPKPILNLKYKDFSIYGHCLVIVVQPYPPLRAASRVPSRVPTIAPVFASRGQGAAPPSAQSVRARTPLFLPDDDERGETPAPFIGRPPVPLFDEEQEDDDGEQSDNGGMMAFSQAMNNYSHLPAGAADDDDDLEGAVFFGDADEVRELS
ncbi:hypothetical protein MSAN_01458100 [Mycena sanguinolenta]|uniref:Uncharacterized protein n=1 Tax=Mycena sanguinolenta TaxID=230812 RepID=A0A8H6YBP5_9AGAR|nr:hypothetical protein MSAN_01458100 [Mycena sanguinolenta]